MNWINDWTVRKIIFRFYAKTIFAILARKRRVRNEYMKRGYMNWQRVIHDVRTHFCEEPRTNVSFFASNNQRKSRAND